MPAAIGDRAPDFELQTQRNTTVSLAEYRGKVVVLYFYPKDETLVCTKEACAFRDAYEIFLKAGAVVIGVSDDPVDSHKRFADHHRLPFILASDPQRKVARSYGVAETLGLLKGRTTFVIDQGGIIRHVFSSAFSAQQHVKEALGAVKKLVTSPQKP